jgi:hypothetical protein
MSSPKPPDSERLARGLASVLRRSGHRGRVEIVDRKPNPGLSTFPTEIVVCRVGAGAKMSLFVKYGGAEFESVYGHRGDIDYEGRVYQEVLRPIGASVTFYGVYREGPGRPPWLVMEYLKGGKKASWSRDPQAMVLSARWIGWFHAECEPLVSDPRLRFLRRYDSEYYLGWAGRAARLFRRSADQFPWLLALCEQFGELVPRLTQAPATVIHGEYFGSNVVYQGKRAWPVDWQSAAIAPGEVDLASLTLGWPGARRMKFEGEYKKHRWPGGAPDGFEEVLAAARVYMNLRWLGDPGMVASQFGSDGEFSPSRSSKKFLAGLFAAGVATGLVETDPAIAESLAVP